MAQYTYEDLLPRLRAIVAEEGEDFVYGRRRDEDNNVGCYYQWNGKPDCGVGRVLYRLGVPIETLQAMDRSGETISQHYPRLRQDHNIWFSPAAEALMESFQQDQDEQVPWGDALNSAITWADRIAKL